MSAAHEPHKVDCPSRSPLPGVAPHELVHPLLRLGWNIAWTALASWTPRPCHRWRRHLLKIFGADVAVTAHIYPDARIWWPPNLSMGEHASLGPGVNCYNVAPIRLEPFANVSQRAHLCSGTHDCDDPSFPLRARPIFIGASAWVATEAFVGPGVAIGEAAVLGARAVTMRDLSPGTINVGNPAVPIRMRGDRRMNRIV